MKVTFDTKIASALGVSLLPGTRVGVELEYESFDASLVNMMNLPSWNLAIDHSLRNGGLEFVSVPLTLSKVDGALLEVQQALDANKAAEANKRCGVHVHVNATHITMKQLWAWTTYYQLIEAFIFKEFADGREENHFCVPTWANTNLQEYFYRDATALYRGITKPSKKNGSDDPYMALHKPQLLNVLRNSKYSAMNLSALKKFGTIEFRQMRGTRRMEVVRKWVHFLARLHECATSYEDAEAVLAEFESNGFERLCGRLGLHQSSSVNKDDIIDCIDGAYMMVGHAPTNFEDLTWEIS